MKTKPFLLATAGATVDGRTIDAAMLDQMAEGYDPKVYGARLNIEHVRGISGQSPFRAYGDVLELSTGDVDVTIHGKTERRRGLFGVLDVTEEAQQLNCASQKVYPSIEIEPNFAGSGKAYLMGVALTDSPASIATDRLQFNRARPGALTLSADAPDQAFAIEFPEAGGDTGSQTFLTKLGGMFDAFAAKLTGDAKPADPKPASQTEGEPAGALDFAQLRPLFEEMGNQFAAQITALDAKIADAVDGFAVKLKAIETTVETTPADSYRARPAATGANGDRAKTDC
jgi:hypothetical protein